MARALVLAERDDLPGSLRTRFAEAGLARTKRSSAYREHILNSRECKLAHYHDTMAAMIRDDPSPA